MGFSRPYVLLAGFVLALSLLAAVTWAGWRQFERGETATALVSHTEQVLTHYIERAQVK